MNTVVGNFKFSAHRWVLLALWLLLPLFVHPQATVVKDINIKPASTSPYRYCKCGPYIYFDGRDERGSELWRSDGTSQGTVRVRDVNPGNASGVNAENFECINGSLLFTGINSSTGLELWKTDGTAEGTAILKDIVPGSGSSFPNTFIPHSGKLFFFLTNASRILELWSSDGTVEGTVPAKTFETLPWTRVQNYGTYANGFYFITNVPDGSNELWVSDGTNTGTTLIKSSPWLYEALGINNKIYFTESLNDIQSIWMSDGTAGPHTLVKTFPTGTFPQLFYAFQDKFFFNANGMIYVSDGTEPGTKEILSGRIAAGVVYQNKFFGITNGGNSLFSSDGTSGGTQTIMDLGAADLSTISGVIPVINNKMIIPGWDDTYGQEPRLSDGTPAGTTLLKDIAVGPTSSFSSYFKAIDGKVLFLADDGIHGKEIWITDGSSSGTNLLKDVNPGTESSCYYSPLLLDANGGLLFQANTEFYGAKDLWRSDGTEAGTGLYYDFKGYASYVGTMGSDPVFFDDKRLVRSTGNPNGTSILKDLSNDLGQNYNLTFSGYSSLNGKFLFYFNTVSEITNLGGELWISDGTADGTSILKDINPGPASAMTSFSGATIGNKMIFAANDGSLGSEVWMTDGTAAETKLMLDIRPGTLGSNPTAFTAFKNEIYFTADDGIQGPALWKSDGTSSGTVTIKSFSPPGGPLLSNLTVAGELIMFSAYDEINGWALWRSDGTTAGTTLVKDIHPGKDNTFTIGYFSYVNELLYFMANDGTHGNELWISNGTPTGTYLVDLEPGLADSNPKYFTAVTDDVVYFSAAGKLWKSDGTASYTTVAADVEPMGNLIYKDGWIYFIGFSRDYGMELFKVEHEDFITAIDPENDIAIRLFPNPASNTIQLASSLNEDVRVSILDLRGVVLSSFLLEANATHTQNVSQFSNGIYIARFDINRGVTVKKFVKK